MAQEDYNVRQARMKQKETFYYWPLQVAYQAFERSYLSPYDWNNVETDIQASMVRWERGRTEEETGKTMTEKALQFASDMVQNVYRRGGSFAEAKYRVQRAEAAELNQTAQSLADERRDLMEYYESAVGEVDDGHRYAAERRQDWANVHHADANRSPWRTTSGAAYLQPRDSEQDEAEAAYSDGNEGQDSNDEIQEDSDSSSEEEEEEEEDDDDDASDMEFSSDEYSE